MVPLPHFIGAHLTAFCTRNLAALATEFLRNTRARSISALHANSPSSNEARNVRSDGRSQGTIPQNPDIVRASVEQLNASTPQKAASGFSELAAFIEAQTDTSLRYLRPSREKVMNRGAAAFWHQYVKLVDNVETRFGLKASLVLDELSTGRRHQKADPGFVSRCSNIAGYTKQAKQERLECRELVRTRMELLHQH